MKKNSTQPIKTYFKFLLLFCIFFTTEIFSQYYPICPSPQRPSSIPPENQYQSTSCSQLLQDCAPLSGEPTLEVNVYVWIMAPTTNSAGGAWTYSLAPTTAATIQACLDGANHTFSTMSVPNLTVAGVSNSYTDSKIKLVLKGYSIVNNDFGYYDVYDYVDFPANYDPNAINIYLGTWTAVVTHTSATAPTYTTLGQNQQIATTTDSQLPWHYNNKIYCTPAFFLSNTPILHDNFAMYGGTIAHEVGHVLGLNHTSSIFSNSLNAITDTGFTFVKNPITSCCIYSHVRDAYFEIYPVPPTQAACTSDNLMSQDAGCNRYLSPQQMGVMQFNLRSRVSHLLTNSSFTTALNRNPTLDYSVTTNETWDKSNRYFKGNITVKTNKTLTIKCGVFMSQNAGIIVEVGGQLIIDGGHVTNIGGKLWDGIYIQGNYGSVQLTPNSANPGSVLYQGIARIKNGGTISQAVIGVRSYGPTSSGGGIIFAQNANFYNNLVDVRMDHPFTGYSVPIPSASWFYNCNFITNDTIGSFNGTYYNPDKHVVLLRVSGVKFRGCIFRYNSPLNNSHGLGIYSVDANYTLDKNGNDSCLFQNLERGIYVNNVNPTKVPVISNSIFKDNLTYAAYFMNAFYLTFTGNLVRASSYGEGVYLNQCKYYKIHNNRFTESIGNMVPGINVYRSKTGAHEIYKNDFFHLYMGINCMDDNGNASNPSDGLKMNCNRFNTQTLNLYDVVLTYTAGLANARVNQTQGKVLGSVASSTLLVRNIYGAVCASNQNKWQIHSGNTYVIDHGSNTNSLSAVTQPTASGCKSSYLNVQDKGISLDYSSHCPVNPLSSGGTSTVNSQLITHMNTYLNTISSNPSTNFFEIQSTVAGKLSIFLTDSLNLYSDSVISILENNQGLMEDADIQTVFAYMRKGDYTTALSKADNLNSTKPDWSAYLIKLIALEKDTVNGIYGLNSNGTNRAFIFNYATTDNIDGQASAQALIKEACDSIYREPHALPTGGGGSRMMNQDNDTNKIANDHSDFVSIFPNPAENGITINYTSENTEPIKIELRDLVGKIIYAKFSSRDQSNNYYIPMENLSNGMYLISVARNKEVIFKEKIIKK